MCLEGKQSLLTSAAITLIPQRLGYLHTFNSPQKRLQCIKAALWFMMEIMDFSSSQTSK